MISEYQKLDSIRKELFTITVNSDKLIGDYKESLREVRPLHLRSAQNLLRYLAFRKTDTHSLQKVLNSLGISRLSSAEGHVMASLKSIDNILSHFYSELHTEIPENVVGIRESLDLLHRNTRNLFGKARGRSNKHIMVTLSDNIIQDSEAFNDLIRQGMSTVRLNCSTGRINEWKKISDRIRISEQLTKSSCHICMDLEGPKIRIGKIKETPTKLKINKKKSLDGSIRKPGTLILSDHLGEFSNKGNFIQVSVKLLSMIKMNQKLFVTDHRGKVHNLNIIKLKGRIISLNTCDKLTLSNSSKFLIKNNSESTNVYEEVVSLKKNKAPKLTLSVGDHLIIEKKNRRGENAVYTSQGQLISKAHVHCPEKRFFENVKTNDKLIFDDGNFEGKITSCNGDEIDCLITFSKKKNVKIKSYCGVSIPGKTIFRKALSSRDYHHLEHISSYADIISLSFVRNKNDVLELIDYLNKHKMSLKGIILKIENLQGFKNLPNIILTAMQHDRIGIMIARGDLAIECGWEKLAKIQEEILRLCEAAHIPVIWATQVMESAAKMGRPSRAEITDATVAQRADCNHVKQRAPHS